MYQALIENALQFLSTFKRDSNKTRDLYKRLELALRADGPRLTAMRRTTARIRCLDQEGGRLCARW